ncbi:competence protein CoiA [Psychrobacillus vulpis]|uniref:Competence protein CoiA n=1 Tax=Psychrobacillus vulpis TaxID=2325572 RepID=A0A544TRZ3_9BACI|nr:competence protein CoiA family protein [Psychrobacillus vulpis]TQR20216.1 hypothetical protein FG384_08630 [Psychrobacillus vulpis]
MVILTAITKQGKIIITANYSNEQLKELRNKNSFLCMQCQEEVILKNGMINIPHFAHKQNSSCSESFSEGESEDHHYGKLQLYSFFQRLKVQAQLEPFIPTIKQRPDILVQCDKTNFAIEFQCSPVLVSTIQKRKLGYQNEQIIPLWILRKPPKYELPTQEIGMMQLSAFRKQFISRHSTYGNTIITYCPQAKHFHYLSNLMHIKTNTYIVKSKSLSLEKQSWPFALLKRLTFEEYLIYLRLYKQQRMKHLNNIYIYNRKGIQSPFLQVCYRWQVLPRNLPLFIGIPTSFAEAFHVHAIEWQIQLIDYLNIMHVSIDQVTDFHCESFLQNRPIGKGSNNRMFEAIKIYIQLLQRCIEKSNSSIQLSKIDIPKMNHLLYVDFLAN